MNYSDIGSDAVKTNLHINKMLEEGPDLVADALKKWDFATIETKKSEAKTYLKLDAEGIKPIAKIEAMVDIDESVITARVHEAIMRSEYKRAEERHLSNKKRADMRTAF